MRVLIVEDEKMTAKAIEASLSHKNVVCNSVNHGREAVDLLKLWDYDAVLLDLMLPEMDGFQTVVEIRRKSTVPIMVLSAYNCLDNTVKGLGLGADDFIAKPFRKEELFARLNAIVRRSKGHAESIIRIGRLTVNIEARTIEIDNQHVHLTSKEYSIMELFAMRKGQVLTKEMFLNHLYGGIDEPELKIIDVFVCKLRKKLFNCYARGDSKNGRNSRARERGFITTVWGQGYKLQDPDEEVSESSYSV